MKQYADETKQIKEIDKKKVDAPSNGVSNKANSMPDATTGSTVQKPVQLSPGALSTTLPKQPTNKEADVGRNLSQVEMSFGDMAGMEAKNRPIELEAAKKTVENAYNAATIPADKEIAYIDDTHYVLIDARDKAAYDQYVASLQTKPETGNPYDFTGNTVAPQIQKVYANIGEYAKDVNKKEVYLRDDAKLATIEKIMSMDDAQRSQYLQENASSLWTYKEKAARDLLNQMVQEGKYGMTATEAEHIFSTTGTMQILDTEKGYFTVTDATMERLSQNASFVQQYNAAVSSGDKTKAIKLLSDAAGSEMMPVIVNNIPILNYIDTPVRVGKQRSANIGDIVSNFWDNFVIGLENTGITKNEMKFTKANLFGIEFTTVTAENGMISNIGNTFKNYFAKTIVDIAQDWKGVELTDDELQEVLPEFANAIRESDAYLNKNKEEQLADLQRLEYKYGLIKQDGSAERWIFDASGNMGQSIGFMMPSIFAGVASGGLGATAGVAQATSLGIMGTNVLTQTYQENITNGIDPQVAMLHAIMTAGVEISTELINPSINGVKLRGSGETVGYTTKNIVMSVINNSVARSFTSLAKDMFEEGVEEYVAEVLDAGINNILEYGMEGQDKKDPLEFINAVWSDISKMATDEQAGYSFTLGALTAGLMQTSQLLQGKQYLNSLYNISTPQMEALVKQISEKMKDSGVNVVYNRGLARFVLATETENGTSIKPVYIDNGELNTEGKGTQYTFEYSDDAKSIDALSEKVDEMTALGFTPMVGNPGETNFNEDGTKTIYASKYVLSPVQNEDGSVQYSVETKGGNLLQTVIHETFHVLKASQTPYISAAIDRFYTQFASRDSYANTKMPGEYVRKGKNTYIRTESGDIKVGTIEYAMYKKRMSNSVYNDLSDAEILEELQVEFMANILMTRPDILFHIFKTETSNRRSEIADWYRNFLVSLFGKQNLRSKTGQIRVDTLKFAKDGAATYIAGNLEAVIRASQIATTSNNIYADTMNSIGYKQASESPEQAAMSKMMGTTGYKNQTISMEMSKNIKSIVDKAGKVMLDLRGKALPDSFIRKNAFGIKLTDIMTIDELTSVQKDLIEGVEVEDDKSLKEILNDADRLIRKIQVDNPMIKSMMINPAVLVNKTGSSYTVTVQANVDSSVMAYLQAANPEIQYTNSITGQKMTQVIDVPTENAPKEPIKSVRKVVSYGIAPHVQALNSSRATMRALLDILKSKKYTDPDIMDKNGDVVSVILDKAAQSVESILNYSSHNKMMSNKYSSSMLSEDLKLSKTLKKMWTDDLKSALKVIYGGNTFMDGYIKSVEGSIDAIDGIIGYNRNSSKTKYQAVDEPDDIESIDTKKYYSQMLNDDSKHPHYYVKLRNTLIERMPNRATVSEIRGLSKGAAGLEFKQFLEPYLKQFNDNEILSKEDVLLNMYELEPKIVTDINEDDWYDDYMFTSEDHRIIAQYAFSKEIGRSRPGHFGENSLSHVLVSKVNNLEGTNNIFIEEHQSDLHQQGEEAGYRGIGQESKGIAELRSGHKALIEELSKELYSEILDENNNPAEVIVIRQKQSGQYDRKMRHSLMIEDEIYNTTIKDFMKNSRLIKETAGYWPEDVQWDIQSAGRSGLPAYETLREISRFKHEPDNSHWFGISSVEKYLKDRYDIDVKIKFINVFDNIKQLIENGFVPTDKIQDAIKKSIAPSGIDRANITKDLFNMGHVVNKVIDTSFNVSAFGEYLTGETSPIRVSSPGDKASYDAINRKLIGFGSYYSEPNKGYSLVIDELQDLREITIKGYAEDKDQNVAEEFVFKGKSHLFRPSIEWTMNGYALISLDVGVTGYNRFPTTIPDMELYESIEERIKFIVNFDKSQNNGFTPRQMYDLTIRKETSYAGPNSLTVYGDDATLGYYTEFDKKWLYRYLMDKASTMPTNEFLPFYLQKIMEPYVQASNAAKVLIDYDTNERRKAAPMPFMGSAWKVNNINQSIVHAVESGAKKIYFTNGLKPTRAYDDSEVRAIMGGVVKNVQISHKEFHYLSGSEEKTAIKTIYEKMVSSLEGVSIAPDVSLTGDQLKEQIVNKKAKTKANLMVNDMISSGLVSKKDRFSTVEQITKEQIGLMMNDRNIDADVADALAKQNIDNSMNKLSREIFSPEFIRKQLDDLVSGKENVTVYSVVYIPIMKTKNRLRDTTEYTLSLFDDGRFEDSGDVSLMREIAMFMAKNSDDKGPHANADFLNKLIDVLENTKPEYSDINSRTQYKRLVYEEDAQIRDEVRFDLGDDFVVMLERYEGMRFHYDKVTVNELKKIAAKTGAAFGREYVTNRDIIKPESGAMVKEFTNRVVIPRVLNFARQVIGADPISNVEDNFVNDKKDELKEAGIGLGLHALNMTTDELKIDPRRYNPKDILTDYLAESPMLKELLPAKHRIDYNRIKAFEVMVNALKEAGASKTKYTDAVNRLMDEKFVNDRDAVFNAKNIMMGRVYDFLDGNVIRNSDNGYLTGNSMYFEKWIIRPMMKAVFNNEKIAPTISMEYARKVDLFFELVGMGNRLDNVMHNSMTTDVFNMMAKMIKVAQNNSISKQTDNTKLEFGQMTHNMMAEMARKVMYDRFAFSASGSLIDGQNNFLYDFMHIARYALIKMKNGVPSKLDGWFGHEDRGYGKLLLRDIYEIGMYGSAIEDLLYATINLENKLLNNMKSVEGLYEFLNKVLIPMFTDFEEFKKNFVIDEKISGVSEKEYKKVMLEIRDENLAHWMHLAQVAKDELQALKAFGVHAYNIKTKIEGVVKQVSYARSVIRKDSLSDGIQRSLLEEFNKNVNDNYLMFDAPDSITRAYFLEINEEVKKMFNDDTKFPLFQALEYDVNESMYYLKMPSLSNAVNDLDKYIQDRKTSMSVPEILSFMKGRKYYDEVSMSLAGKDKVSKDEISDIMDELDDNKAKAQVLNLFTSEKIDQGMIPAYALKRLISESNYVYNDQAKWTGILDMVNEINKVNPDSMISIDSLRPFMKGIPQLKVEERSTKDMFGEFPHYYGYSSTSQETIQGYDGNKFRLQDNGEYKEMVFTVNDIAKSTLKSLKDMHFSRYDNLIGTIRMTVGAEYDTDAIDFNKTKGVVIEEIQTPYETRNVAKTQEEIDRANRFASQVNELFKRYREYVSDNMMESIPQGSRVAITDGGKTHYDVTVAQYLKNAYRSAFEILGSRTVRSEDNRSYVVYTIGNTDGTREIGAIEYNSTEELIESFDYKLMNDLTSTLPAEDGLDQSERVILGKEGMVDHYMTELMNTEYFMDDPINALPYSKPNLFKKLAIKQVIEQVASTDGTELFIASGIEQNDRFKHDLKIIKEVMGTRAKVSVSNGLLTVSIKPTILDEGEFTNKAFSFSMNAKDFLSSRNGATVTDLTESVNDNFGTVQNIWTMKENFNNDEMTAIKEYVRMALSESDRDKAAIQGMGLSNGLEITSIRDRSEHSGELSLNDEWVSSDEGKALRSILDTFNENSKMGLIAKIIYQSKYFDSAYEKYSDGDYFDFEQITSDVKSGKVKGELLSVRLSHFINAYDRQLINLIQNDYSQFGLSPRYVWVSLNTAERFDALTKSLSSMTNDQDLKSAIWSLSITTPNIQQRFDRIEGMARLDRVSKQFRNKFNELRVFVREIDQYRDKPLTEAQYEDHKYDVARDLNHGTFMIHIPLTQELRQSISETKKAMQAIEFDTVSEMFDETVSDKAPVYWRAIKEKQIIISTKDVVRSSKNSSEILRLSAFTDERIDGGASKYRGKNGVLSVQKTRLELSDLASVRKALVDMNSNTHPRYIRSLAYTYLISKLGQLSEDVMILNVDAMRSGGGYAEQQNILMMSKDGSWGLVVISGMPQGENKIGKIITVSTLTEEQLKVYGVTDPEILQVGKNVDSIRVFVEKNTLMDYIGRLKKVAEQFDRRYTGDDSYQYKDKFTQATFAYQNLEMAAKRLASLDDRKYANLSMRSLKQALEFDDEDATGLRKHEQTILESGQVSKRAYGIVEKQIVQGDFNYVKMSDKKSLEYATEVIAGDLDKAYQDFESAFRNNRRMTKNDIAIAEMLISEMSKTDSGVKNKTKKVINLISDLAIIGTELGQSVQALSLIKKLTAQGQLLHLRRTTDRLSRFYLEKGKKLEFEYNETLVEELLKLTDPTEIAQKVDQIKVDLASQVPSTWMDKLNAWRYLSMLGNPRTHLRNIVGNFLMLPLVRVKDILATAPEQFLPKDQRTKALMPSMKALEVARKDFAQNKAMILGEGKYDASTELERNKPIFKNKVLEAIRRFNFAALEVEDAAFSHIHYVHAFAGFITARGINVDTITEAQMEQAREYATMEAQKATFRDASELSNLINHIERSNKVASYVIAATVPFKKTPINIVKRSIEYSPIGLVSAITKASYDLYKGRITPAEWIDKLTSGLTGTGVVGVGYYLFYAGILSLGSGGDASDKEKAFNSAIGVQNYSIVINGQSYTIDWAVPASLPLIVGAEIGRWMDENDGGSLFNVVPSALVSMLDPLFELTMLQGITDTLQSFSTSGATAVGEAMTTMASSYMGQFIPTIFGQIARIVDPVRRTTYAPKDSEWNPTAEIIIRKLMNKIPFISTFNEPVINVMGEVELNDSGKTLLDKILLNMVSVGYYKDGKTSAAEDAILTLFNQSLSQDALPRIAPKTFTLNGEVYILDGSQRTEFAKTMGTESKNLVTNLISSDLYRSMTIDEKVDVFAKIYNYAYGLAKDGVTPNPDKWYQKVKNATTVGITPVRYFEADLIFSKVTSTDNKTKEYNFIDRLADAGYGVVQITQLLLDNNYKVSDKDYAYIMARKGE